MCRRLITLRMSIIFTAPVEQNHDPRKKPEWREAGASTYRCFGKKHACAENEQFVHCSEHLAMTPGDPRFKGHPDC